MKRRYKILIKDKANNSSKEITVVFDVKNKHKFLDKLSNYIYYFSEGCVLFSYAIIFALGMFASLKWVSLLAGIVSIVLPVLQNYTPLTKTIEQFICSVAISLVFVFIIRFLEPEIVLSNRLNFLRTDNLGTTSTYVGIMLTLWMSMFSEKNKNTHSHDSNRKENTI